MTAAHPSDAQIRALYASFLDGWNRQSGASVAAGFADDGDIIGFDGTHPRGRRSLAAALVDGDQRVHCVQRRVEVALAGRDHPRVRQQYRDAGRHGTDRPDDPDVTRGLVVGEDRAQVGGDRQPAAVVTAVEADDVPVVGEPGRHGRTAAPVPPVEELVVERADLGVVRVGCGHA